MAVKRKSAKPGTAAKKKTAATRKTARKAAGKKKAPAGKKAAARKKTATRKAPAAKKKTAPKKPAKKAAAGSKKKPTAKRTAARKPAAARSRKPVSGQVGPVPGIAPYVEKRGEEYMNEDQVAHFRNILLTWKKELMEEVDRTVHHMQDDAANFPDPNDRATQESEFSMELRARDRERKLIKKINESLEALDNDEYGYCEACGVEIGVKRLEARPTATLCIDCKILDEIREKQMG